MAARPSPPPLRRSSWIIVPRIRPPLAPIGCPSATAPPFTFAVSGSVPSIFTELSATDEKASFTSTRFTSPIDLPAFCSACAPALAGVRASDARGLLHHVLLVERRAQPVPDHQIDDRSVAHPVPEAALGQRIRRIRHRLHPAGHDDLDVTGANHRVGDLHRPDRRGADLV